MKVTILGNNSALPAFGRHPTAQAVSVYGETILIDCGEGTQNQMHRYSIRWRNIHHIFISHLHGDHYFGLPGLLNSMSLMGRVSPVYVYGPPHLQHIIDEILNVADTVLSYPYNFYPLPDGKDVLVDNPYFKMTCFPVEHRIQCHGLVIEKKTRGRKIMPEKCKEFGVEPIYFESLRTGNDFLRNDGILIKNELVTEEGHAPKKYAFCADTRYTESYLDVIADADAIYHECTYPDIEREKAYERFHSTTVQAAEIAKKANAKLLLLGHFSSKYKELDSFKEEAQQVFENTALATEGVTFEL